MQIKNEIPKEKYLVMIRGLTDCVFFINYYLDYLVEWFHIEWINAFENNNFVCLLAPRGHGKTYLVAGYIIWKIITQPNIRILIVTVNQNKASEMMTTVKNNLEFNTKLTDTFGEQVGNLWSSDKIRVKKAGWTHKEPTLQVLGVNSSQVSSHYDMIVLDDVVDDKNVATEHKRGEVIRWYDGTLFPQLEPAGKIFNIGTKWHMADFHSYIERDKTFVIKKYKAIIKEPGVGGVPLNAKPEVLWPFRFPYEDEWRIDEKGNKKLYVGLKTIRDKKIGSIQFAMQYQNEVIQTEDSPIKQEWIQSAINKYETLESMPDYMEKYMGVDLASQGKESDYFTIVVIGLDNLNNMYILDCYRDKLSMTNQLDEIYKHDKFHNPIKIGVESVAGQKIIVDEWKEDSTLPIIPMKSSWVNDKWTRVNRLSVLFETGRVFLPKRFIHLTDELLEFPRGEHDDCIDALCFAYQSADKGKVTDWKKIINIIKSR